MRQKISTLEKVTMGGIGVAVGLLVTSVVLDRTRKTEKVYVAARPESNPKLEDYFDNELEYRKGLPVENLRNCLSEKRSNQLDTMNVSSWEEEISTMMYDNLRPHASKDTLDIIFMGIDDVPYAQKILKERGFNPYVLTPYDSECPENEPNNFGALGWLRVFPNDSIVDGKPVLIVAEDYSGNEYTINFPDTDKLKGLGISKVCIQAGFTTYSLPSRQFEVFGHYWGKSIKNLGAFISDLSNSGIEIILNGLKSLDDDPWGEWREALPEDWPSHLFQKMEGIQDDFDEPKFEEYTPEEKKEGKTSIRHRDTDKIPIRYRNDDATKMYC